MSKKIIFSIDLEKEPDFLGNKAKVNLLGVNQLFRPSKKGTLKLTEEGRKYKAFLKSKVKKIREDLNLKKAIDYPIMVYVRIYHTVKLKNNGKKDERYTRDVDNLFKPLQDALEGKDGIWSNDKKIRFIT
jgi:Holliday junction resolvase RusA-like endonuclease